MPLGSPARALGLAAALSLVATEVVAAPPSGQPPPPELIGPEREPEGPAEGPAKPTDPADRDPELDPNPDLNPDPNPDPEAPGIEFAPPPDGEDPTPKPPSDPEGATAPGGFYLDPGTAPSNGNGMLVLGSITLSLTGLAVGLGAAIGDENGTPNSVLIPALVIGGAAGAGMGGGSLYLGITRHLAWRRWAIGHRVIATPQGGGWRVAALWGTLGTLGGISWGSAELSQGRRTNAYIGFGSAGGAALIATVGFILSRRYARDYAATGGWRRAPLPPVPTARVEWRPTLQFVPSGVGFGVSGRF